MLQDGADEHDEVGMSRPTLMELRNEESRRSAATIGWNLLSFSIMPDLADSVAQASEEVQAPRYQRKIDALFVPFVLDAHPDHRTANYIVAGALKGVSWNVRVFGYEVWGLCIPNILVVIDDVIEEKMRMLSCFTFANNALDYVHSTRGLICPFPNAGRWRMPIRRAIL